MDPARLQAWAKAELNELPREGMTFDQPVETERRFALEQLPHDVVIGKLKQPLSITAKKGELPRHVALVWGDIGLFYG